MRQYTEKEIMIFNGVQKLSKQGKNMYTVTVQNIAQTAEIGKGTIYDYFSSKEDIIIKSILYSTYKEIKTARIQTSDAESFKDKIFCIYDILIENISSSLSTMHLIMSIGGINEIEKILENEKQEYQEIMQEIAQLFSETLKAGIHQGVIKQTDDTEYVQMAILSNIIAAAKMMQTYKMLKPEPPADKAKVKEKAYKMLIKILN